MSKNKGFSDTSANRYSLALYELASEASVINKVEENSNSFLKLISNSNDFKDMILYYNETVLGAARIVVYVRDDVKGENISKTSDEDDVIGKETD